MMRNKKKKEPENIANVLDSFLKKKGYYSDCKESEVIQRWDELVGDRIADVTEVLEVKNGVLIVRVPSASWRQEMSFFKKMILTEIRSKTQCKTIWDVRFI